MSEIDDGVIKYQRQFTKCEALKSDEYWPLEKWREKLFHLKLIGEYPEVFIGYGNMSWRMTPARPIRFVITGTQTGKHPILNGQHYTRVNGYNLEQNLIIAEGPLDASSEALTHACLYECNDKIQAIFHIHDKVIWQSMLDKKMLATSKDIPYGTVGMAKAVRELVGNKTSGCFAMAGHEDGIVAFGENLDQTGVQILKLVERFKK